VHAVVARSTFLCQNAKKATCSDHFWTFRCRFAWPAQRILHRVKREHKRRGFVAASTTTTNTLHYIPLHSTATTTTTYYNWVAFFLDAKKQIECELHKTCFAPGVGFHADSVLLWIVDFLFIIIYQRVAPSIPIAQPNVMRQLETKRNHSRVGKARLAQEVLRNHTPRRLPHAMA
jgi:hypothetical protein